MTSAPASQGVASKKMCTKCKQSLPLECFGKAGKSKDGLHTFCRNCHRAASKRWREANPTYKLDRKVPCSVESCQTLVTPGRMCISHAEGGSGILTYGGAHMRVRRTKGSASEHQCTDCDQPAQEWSYTGGDSQELIVVDASLHEFGLKYSLDPDYYLPRCRPCHRQHDAALRKEKAV